MSERIVGLVEALEVHSVERSAQPAFIYLVDGEKTERRMSYGELYGRSRAIAQWLRSRGMVGERVLLIFPPQKPLEFICAFFGCLLARAVAVPIRPSERGAGRSDADHIGRIVEDCVPRCALTVEGQPVEWDGEVAPISLEADWEPTAAPEVGEFQGGDTNRADADLVAFIQYTSGSTGQPKGVVVTHRNLADNLAAIDEVVGARNATMAVSWLPLHHDMGLIGMVLAVIYAGTSTVLMSPLHFLQRPIRWLKAISRYRATHSGAPDFAYRLCAKLAGPNQLEGLDLSSWRVAFLGAEPVRAQTLEAFTDAFSSVGFDRRSFLPSYGLAEATLMVSGNRGDPLVANLDDDALASGEFKLVERHERTRRVVSVGAPVVGAEVHLVDPETAVLVPEGRVGEIWVRSESVALGYWARGELSREHCGATIEPGGRGPFLRTGDLGAMHRGELFVTGRLKDLIVVRGRNIYPQDIEAGVEAADARVRHGGVAAFSLERGGHESYGILLSIETCERELAAEIASRVQQAVTNEFGVAPQVVAVVRPGALRRTSSGKIRRSACRMALVSGEIEPLVVLGKLDLEGRTQTASRPSQRVVRW